MTQLPILAPYVASFGVGAIYTGVILGSYSFVNMAGNLVAGPVIDAFDRRVTIGIGMAVAGLAVAGYSMATRPGHLLVLRILHGAGGAVLIPAVFAWAGDRARAGAAGRSMGHAGAAVAFAAALGPALGGIGGAYLGAPTVFLGLGLLLCATSAGVLAGLVREHRRQAQTQNHNAAALAGSPRGITVRGIPRAVLQALRNPHLVLSFHAVFSLAFALGTLAFVLPLSMTRLGYSSGYTGLLFSLFSIAAILFSLLPTNRLPDRIGPVRVAAGGTAVILVALTALALMAAQHVTILAAIMIAYGIGFGAVFPATGTIVVLAAGPDRRGAAFGVYYAFFSLGVFLGPVTAGFATTLDLNPYGAAVLVTALTGAAQYRELRRRPGDT